MNRPVVFKGLAKRSPAFELFTDEFLKSFTGADEVNVTAEPHKKEIRNSKPFMMSFTKLSYVYYTNLARSTYIKMQLF